MLTSKIINDVLGVRVAGDVYHSEGPSGEPVSINYDQSTVTERANYTNPASDWFKFGERDMAPNILRSLYRKSTIHNTSINLKAGLIHGNGLVFTPLEDYITQTPDGELIRQTQNLSDAERETLIHRAELFARRVGMWQYYKRAAMQYAIYGGYVSMRQYFDDETASTRLQCVYVESLCNARLSVKRKFYKEHGHQSTHIFLSKNFARSAGYCKYSRYLGSSENHTRVPFDMGPTARGTRARMLGRFTDYRDYYPTADYESEDALRYIDTDGALSRKDLNGLLNGFTLRYIVVRYRARKAKEEDEIAERKKDKALMQQGATGIGGKDALHLWAQPHVNDSNSVETPAPIEIITIPHNNTTDRYNILREERLMKILNAHGIIIPELIGLSPQVGKGFQNQADHLITAQQQLYFNFARPAKEIINSDLGELLLQAGIPVAVTSKSASPNFRIMDTRTMQYALTTNEIRGLYDFKPLAEDDPELERIRDRQLKVNNNVQ